MYYVHPSNTSTNHSPELGLEDLSNSQEPLSRTMPARGNNVSGLPRKRIRTKFKWQLPTVSSIITMYPYYGLHNGARAWAGLEAVETLCHPAKHT